MVNKTYGILLLLVVIISGCVKPPVEAEERIPFEGKVEYEITYDDGVDYKAEGLPNRAVATFRKHRMLMAMVVGDNKLKIISDREKKSLVIVNFKDGRHTATFKDEEFLNAIEQVEYENTKKVKKIAKHRCIKAVSQYGTGINAKPFEFYYTPELSNYNYFWHYGFRNVNGILLKFTTYDLGIKATFTAVNVSPEEVNPRIFLFPPNTVFKY